MQKTLLALIRLTSEQAKALADNPESLKGIIRATNGAIKCHVDIVSGAGNVLKVASNGVNPVTGAINLVSNVAQNVQLYKLQGTTNRIANTVTKISGKMDMVANLSWLNAGLSVVNIGATVISTEILCKKMDKIYSAVNQNQKLLNDIQASLYKLQGYANENIFKEFDTYDQKLNALIQDMQIEKSKSIWSTSQREDIIMGAKSLLMSIHRLMTTGCMPMGIGLNMLADLLSKFAMAVLLFSIEYYYERNRVPANYEGWVNTIKILFDDTMKDRIYNYYAYDVPDKLKEREIRNILTVAEKDYCGELIEDIECQMLLANTFSKEQYTDLVTNKIPQCAESIIEEMQLTFD